MASLSKRPGKLSDSKRMFHSNSQSGVSRTRSFGLDDQDGLKVCSMSICPECVVLLRFWCNAPSTVPVLLRWDTALVLIMTMVCESHRGPACRSITVSHNVQALPRRFPSSGRANSRFDPEACGLAAGSLRFSPASWATLLSALFQQRASLQCDRWEVQNLLFRRCL